jgi:hypothetical protein
MAKAMKALDAAGKLFREEIRKAISVKAPKRYAPFVKWGRIFLYRARTKALREAPPRIVNRWLWEETKSFRKGSHTVRVQAGVPYALSLEKGTRHGKHAFIVPTFDRVKGQMWREFVRVLRG